MWPKFELPVWLKLLLLGPWCGWGYHIALAGNADEANYLHQEQEVNKTGKGKCRVSSQSLLTDGANDLRPSPKPVTCTTFRTSSSLSQELSSALLPNQRKVWVIQSSHLCSLFRENTAALAVRRKQGWGLKECARLYLAVLSATYTVAGFHACPEEGSSAVVVRLCALQAP